MSQAALPALDANGLLHATTVAIADRAVLLIGPSGSGKSDLALRLIDRGATLVSDDYTQLIVVGETLIAAPPASISGCLEVRHLGIIAMPHVTNVPVALAIRLDDKPPRMPDETFSLDLMGTALPLIMLSPFEASAPIKVELALRATPCGAG